jgi:hypothetical protein
LDAADYRGYDLFVPKLLRRWITCFQRLADLMLSVEQRRREWRERTTGDGQQGQQARPGLTASSGSIWDDESLGMQSAGALPTQPKPTKNKNKKSSSKNGDPKTDDVADNDSIVNTVNGVDVLSFFEDLAHDESRFELWSLSGSDVDHAEILAMHQFVSTAEALTQAAPAANNTKSTPKNKKPVAGIAEEAANTRPSTSSGAPEAAAGAGGSHVQRNISNTRTGSPTTPANIMSTTTAAMEIAQAHPSSPAANRSASPTAIMNILRENNKHYHNDAPTILTGISLLQRRLEPSEDSGSQNVDQWLQNAAGIVIAGLSAGSEDDFYCIKLATMLACQLLGDITNASSGSSEYADVIDIASRDGPLVLDSLKEAGNKIEDYVITPLGTMKLLQLFTESVQFRLDAEEEQVRSICFD